MSCLEDHKIKRPDGSTAAQVTILYSGNFGLGHELDTILRAVREVKVDADIKLVLVGGGIGLADTRKLVKELELTNAEFRPPVPLYRLPKLLAEGDIHLVAQKPRTEGLIVPSKIYGILAVGRPSLFVGPTDCEVSRIVRDSGSGFAVAPGDIKAAANALTQLAGDPEMRREMGERAGQYYEKHFGRKRSVAKIITLIEQVTKNGRQQPEDTQ